MTGIQVEPEHYRWLDYNTKQRWASYWHQIHELLAVGARSCLVIGPGDGTVSELLKRLDVEVTTMDIDDRLGPDLVGDIRAIPAADGAFDATLCAQVLEHIPFEEVPKALEEMRRVTRTAVVLSIPQHGRAWELTFRVPTFKRWARGGVLPARTAKTFDGQHHWELGARNFRRRKVEPLLRAAYEVEREYTVPDNPYHRFYVLRPR